ncbi:MAG: hypothetical protein ACI4SV_04585, partial [Duodenibacillus sp.]
DNPAPTEQVKGPTESLLEAEKKEGDADEQKPEGAPESYQPFDVDGQQFTQEQLEGFASTARELGLSQENAQKMLSAMVPTARKYLVDDLVVKSKQWAEDTRNDPEIGGAHFNENLGIATAAYQRYATPELKAILTNSGLGNHPEVIRLFCRIGKETRQDTGVSGSASAPAEGRRRRYPNSNMVVDE